MPLAGTTDVLRPIDRNADSGILNNDQLKVNSVQLKGRLWDVAPIIAAQSLGKSLFPKGIATCTRW
ncbi:MAG: hypothetical protein ABIO86_04660, partial [Sphingomonas sp.]